MKNINGQGSMSGVLYKYETKIIYRYETGRRYHLAKNVSILCPINVPM